MKKYLLSFILYGLLLAQISPEEKARQLTEDARRHTCFEYLEGYKKASIEERKGYITVLESHINEGLDVHAIPEPQQHYYSPFGLAAVGAVESGDPALFAIFLTKGADPRKIACISKLDTDKLAGSSTLRLISVMARNSHMSVERRLLAQHIFGMICTWQDMHQISDEEMGAAMELQVVSLEGTHAQETDS